MKLRGVLAIALVLGAVAQPVGAAGPVFKIAARETFDAWGVPAGVDRGTSVLNKVQLSALIGGDPLGLTGWKAHFQIFRFDGQALSARMGDVQTAENLEAPPVTRLFEAWVSREWGHENRSLTMRAGLIDLNSQFDSVEPAGLFINSSHGIGPDLSRSGRNGPSIYPVSAPGVTLTAVPSDKWTFRLGVLGGVPGDPDRPRALVAERLSRHDGVLTIAQVDRQIGKATRVEAGLWRYSARGVGVAEGRPHDAGAYASLELPLAGPPRLTGWVRAGFADGRAQTVGGYVGGGVVQQGTIASRPDDRLGLAIAHAIISDAGVDTLGVHHAETTFELTYQMKLSEQISVQPDLQYIRHPAGIAHAPDSIGFGLRLAFNISYPKTHPIPDAGDPTLPPDGAPSTAPDDAPALPTPPGKPKPSGG